MKSMTGFGHVSKSLVGMDITVDLRTVNSRYFDFRPRLGKELAALEGELKKEVQRKVTRGRAELFVEISPRTSEQLELNEALVRNYLGLADQLRSEGLEGEITLRDLLNLPGVCVPKESCLNAESVREGVIEAVREAADQVLEARRVEGSALKVEFKDRLNRLVCHLDSVAVHAGEFSDYYEQKLSARLREMLRDHEFELDQGRLAQEVFYYAEKADITEEMTRLRSHVERFSEYMTRSEQGPLGKTLDFLCQEMNREINTILAKSAMVAVSRIAIEAKGEIEKIREQVQNVE